jgi:hypothetical protein
VLSYLIFTSAQSQCNRRNQWNNSHISPSIRGSGRALRLMESNDYPHKRQSCKEGQFLDRDASTLIRHVIGRQIAECITFKWKLALDDGRWNVVYGPCDSVVVMNRRRRFIESTKLWENESCLLIHQLIFSLIERSQWIWWFWKIIYYLWGVLRDNNNILLKLNCFRAEGINGKGNWEVWVM